MTEEEIRAKIAELEAKDELTEEEMQQLADLKDKLEALKVGGGGGSLNIGG